MPFVESTESHFKRLTVIHNFTTRCRQTPTHWHLNQKQFILQPSLPPRCDDSWRQSHGWTGGFYFLVLRAMFLKKNTQKLQRNPALVCFHLRNTVNTANKDFIQIEPRHWVCLSLNFIEPLNGYGEIHERLFICFVCFLNFIYLFF